MKEIHKRSDFDLMAPVGSFESLMAAIEAGADSVYFGLGKLNMRARSSINFSVEDLKKIARICKKFNKKIYLTLNIVFYDSDMDEMREIINMAIENGVDAIIASDQAAIHYAFSKGMEVHLSTQTNISNIESIKFYSRFADVVVLARELNLDQITTIRKAIIEEQIKGPSGELIRLELFVHGALCMAISGKCYLSLHNHNHSANRGDCLQDCRREYYVQDLETELSMEVKNKYIMSPKDLCTIHFLNKIIDSGIRVFKIEGRARSPEYVKTVVQCYNEAINSIIQSTYSEERITGWKERLSGVFNRGFWDGYYLGQKLGEWSPVYGSKSNEKKDYIAKCLNYFPKIGIGEFLCEAGEISVGDKIFLMGPTTGVIEQTADEIRVDLKRAERAKAGEKFSMPVRRKVRRADKLYKVIYLNQ